ncbi:hypothetical protein [Brevibacterium marinum]|uniref:Uncharacterized protein n=1 Tax=Brevibacterium marinum TaxID=418643 RepID=A0A846RT26_9MICO|nr:hypothetical protein [Brevibacterium marinum]NJC56919.1 hypothetical protein [Brevibacterium marinum]
MYVMTIDQRGSRDRADEVPEALDMLQRVETARGFTRTIGDEVQGVLDSPEQVSLAVRLLAGRTGWHIGIGIGPVDVPLPDSTAEGRGEAFYAARRAVEAAKGAPAHLVVDAAAAQAHLAESALRLMVWTIENIHPRSRRYIEHRLDHPDSTQADIAAEFDVSQQAVSRVLSPGGVELIAGALTLSAFHLSQSR